MPSPHPLPDAAVPSPAPAGTVAWLDLAHLDRQTDGDAALAAELLALFDAQAGEIVGRIRRGEPAPPLAHRLKGAARAVGAWQVAAAADDLEEGRGEAEALAGAVTGTAEAIARHRAASGPRRWGPV